MLMQQLPNMITILRIAGSIYLACLPTLSVEFYVCYIFCGISDMLDGFLARRLNVQSKTGAVLDSVADMIFVLVCFIRLLPVFDIPVWVWVWIAAVTAVKLMSLLIGFVRYKRFGFLHTKANKLTGLLLFLFPLAVCFSDTEKMLILLCSVAFVAAVDELRRICKNEVHD